MMARLEMTTAECEDVDLGAEVKMSALCARGFSIPGRLFSRALCDYTQYITFCNVDDGGILHQAGVRVGDILERLNGTQLKEVGITHLLEMIKQKPILFLGLQRCSQFHRYTSITIFLEPTIVDSCPTLKRSHLYWNVPAHEITSDFFITNSKGNVFKFVRTMVAQVKGKYGIQEYWLTLQASLKQVTFHSNHGGTLSTFLVHCYSPLKSPGFAKYIIFNPLDSQARALSSSGGSLNFSMYRPTQTKRGTDLMFIMERTDGGLYTISTCDDKNPYYLTIGDGVGSGTQRAALLKRRGRTSTQGFSIVQADIKEAMTRKIQLIESNFL